MAKFIYGYHGGSGMPESAADQEKVMAAWGAWFGSMGEAIIDGGNPVGAAATVASDGSISDGGGPNPLTGYTTVEAADLDAAVVLAKGCPVLDDGGNVEVCAAIDM